MMNGMMMGDGTMFGMGLFGFLVVIALVLAIGAFVKYIISSRH